MGCARRRSIAALALLGAAGSLCGCGLVLDTTLAVDSSVITDAAPSDSVARRDASPEDATVPPSDSGVRDTGIAPTDATMSDAAEGCVYPPLDPSVVAWWTFDDPGLPLLLPDRTGVNDGIMSAEGAYLYVPAGEGCGEALRFVESGPTAASFGVAPHHESFLLPTGSIELRVRVPDHASYGLVSRDRLGTSGSGGGPESVGHLLIGTTYDGHITARIQQVDVEGWACSNARVTPGAWTHIALNFGVGGMELYVDGVLQTGTGTYSYGQGPTGRNVSCATTANAGNIGLDRNTEPFYFGASSSQVSGMNPTPNLFFIGGEIDDVILRSTRFSTD